MMPFEHSRLQWARIALLALAAFATGCASDPLKPPGPSAGEIVLGKVVGAVLDNVAEGGDADHCDRNGASDFRCIKQAARTEQYLSERERAAAAEERRAAAERVAEYEAALTSDEATPVPPEPERSIMYEWSEPAPRIELPAGLSVDDETSSGANASDHEAGDETGAVAE